MNLSRPTPKEFRPNAQWIALPALIVVSAFVIVRFFSLINQYAVNILFWDAWDFYTPLFQGRKFLSHFLFQYTYHRGGLGLLLQFFLAKLTGWNTRVDSFTIAGIIVLAYLLCLSLRRRLFGEWRLIDIALPLMFLHTGQLNVPLVAPGVGAASVPLLLLFAYCYAWIIEAPIPRYVSVAVIHFFMIFTGFGFISCPLFLFLIALDGVRRYREGGWKKMGGPAFCLLSLGLSVAFFLHDYWFTTGTKYSLAPRGPLWHYLIFPFLPVGNFLGFFFGISGGGPKGFVATAIVGGLATVAFVLVVVKSLPILLRDVGKTRERAMAFMILAGSSLLFLSSLSIGRTFLGLGEAQQSRYLTLLIPGFVALYLYASALPSRWLQNANGAVLIILVAASSMRLFLPGRIPDEGPIRDIATWKNCYLRTEDEQRCDEEAHRQIFPDMKRTHFKLKMQYLKAHHLNLYLDAPPYDIPDKQRKEADDRMRALFFPDSADPSHPRWFEKG